MQMEIYNKIRLKIAFFGGCNYWNHGKNPTQNCFFGGVQRKWKYLIKKKLDFAYEKMSVSFCHDRPCSLILSSHYQATS